MITVHYKRELFDAIEQENGNVIVRFKPEVREVLGLDYPTIAIEVEQGNHLDSNIVASEV